MADTWTIKSGTADNITIEILIGTTTYTKVFSLGGITSTQDALTKIRAYVTKFRAEIAAAAKIPDAVAANIGYSETF